MNQTVSSILRIAGVTF